MMIAVTVNGEPKRLDDGATVARLLAQLQVQPERVVVEVNVQIIKPAQRATTLLQSGDVVEIVQFVGGGTSTEESLDKRWRLWY